MTQPGSGMRVGSINVEGTQITGMRVGSINVEGTQITICREGSACFADTFFDWLPASGVGTPPYTMALDRLNKWKTSHKRWRIHSISSTKHNTHYSTSGHFLSAKEATVLTCSAVSSGLVEVVRMPSACAKAPKKSPWILRPRSLPWVLDQLVENP